MLDIAALIFQWRQHPSVGWQWFILLRHPIWNGCFSHQARHSMFGHLASLPQNLLTMIVPLFFWAKLNQGNEVARQNISKGMWVVSRVRIHIFLATKIEGTDPGASFLGCQRPSQHPAVASPQQIDKMPSGKPRFELWTNNGQCSSRICDLSNLRVAFLHHNLQKYFELSQFDQWNPAPLPKREVSQTEN